MLQFYIVWQRCLLDMPYHKYHLLLVSGPMRSRLKFISKELRGGLSFTAEAWQRERAATEPSQSRPGKITPEFQWHNGQNQSGSQQTIRSAQRDERRREREITYLHHQLVSVMKKYNRCLTACWLQGVTWWRVFWGFLVVDEGLENRLARCKHTAEVPLVCLCSIQQ